MVVVRDLMTASPATVGPSATLADCAKMMMTLGVRHLPVVDDGVVGLLDDASVFAHGMLVDDDVWLGFTESGPDTAGEACAIAIELPADLDLTRALPRLRRQGAAIVTDEGAVVGVISEYDVVAMARSILPADQSVALHSSAPVHRAKPSDEAGDALARMRALAVRHLVIERAGVVESVVTLRDIVSNWHGGAMPLSDLQSSTIVTITPEVSLRDAAAKMHLFSIGCLPVLNPKGRCVSIVTRTDILNAVAVALEDEALFDPSDA